MWMSSAPLSFFRLLKNRCKNKHIRCRNWKSFYFPESWLLEPWSEKPSAKNSKKKEVKNWAPPLSGCFLFGARRNFHRKGYKLEIFFIAISSIMQNLGLRLLFKNSRMDWRVFITCNYEFFLWFSSHTQEKNKRSK